MSQKCPYCQKNVIVSVKVDLMRTAEFLDNMEELKERQKKEKPQEKPK
jgi:hypothetical protein